MKKEYKKPVMEIVPFVLNEAVASGCKIDVYQNVSDNTCQETDVWKEIEGMFVIDFNFTEDNGCNSYVSGYCYFASAQVVFNS